MFGTSMELQPTKYLILMHLLYHLKNCISILLFCIIGQDKRYIDVFVKKVGIDSSLNIALIGCYMSLVMKDGVSSLLATCSDTGCAYEQEVTEVEGVFF